MSRNENQTGEPIVSQERAQILKQLSLLENEILRLESLARRVELCFFWGKDSEADSGGNPQVESQTFGQEICQHVEHLRERVSRAQRHLEPVEREYTTDRGVEERSVSVNVPHVIQR